MNERVNSGSASLNEKESSTNVGGGVDAGGGGGNIFDPNIGFGKYLPKINSLINFMINERK